jgi:hypothetical protein
MNGIDTQRKQFEPDSIDTNGPAKNYVDELPEFRDYVYWKYGVELEEDLVIMIEDLIERQRQKSGMT